MTWKCGNCGEELTEEKLAETIRKGLPKGDELSEKADISDVSEVLLVDCRNCGEENATYKKIDTTGSNQESNTKARSKMLQAARN